ncbi:MAG TPA: DUF2752 domain-containing protein [Candidatus Polarisedimenticolia bacterium]|nr:DUF2752 domain-containing protein [Candidatus Polarisedimenticolia bacterium]
MTGALLAASLLLPPVRPLPFDVCLFHRMTGIPCLTCGLTRSVCLFVRGDWSESLRMHPAGWLAFIVLVAALPWLAAEAAADRSLAVKARARLLALALGMGGSLAVLGWGGRLMRIWPPV